jgi:hypothetical protein
MICCPHPPAGLDRLAAARFRQGIHARPVQGIRQWNRVAAAGLLAKKKGQHGKFSLF